MNQVEEQLLAANGLTQQSVYDGLSMLLEHQLDYADLYFQGSFHESWVMEDGIIKDGSYNIEQGVGIRAVSGEKTGLSYSDQVNFDAITFFPTKFSGRIKLIIVIESVCKAGGFSALA